jgi:hypothetical protein
MGYIKEPLNVDFVVDSTPLNSEDRKLISEVIAYYKATGRKKSFVNAKKRVTKALNKSLKAA